jgi:hypothetical protein
MEDFFIIPHNMLKGKPPEIGYELFALEYAQDTLNIPIINIEDAYYDGVVFTLHLKALDEHTSKKDWYINLFLVSTYIRAS